MKSRLLKYELKNILGNIFMIFFGIGLPIFMGIVIPLGVVKDVPDNFKNTVVTTIVLNMSIMIPLCISLIGHSSIFSLELEKKIPLRLNLFGISQKDVLLSKLISYMLVLIINLIIYLMLMYLVHRYDLPKISGLLEYVLYMVIFSLIFLLIAHSIAMIFKKFSIAYAFSMALYFFLLFTSGSMGLRYDDFPKILKVVADNIPMTHFNIMIYKIWQGKYVNQASLIQSTILFLVLAIILYLIALKVNNREKS